MDKITNQAKGFSIVEISLGLLILAGLLIFLIRQVGVHLKGQMSVEARLIEENYVKLIRDNLSDTKACQNTFLSIKKNSRPIEVETVLRPTGRVLFSNGQKVTNNYQFSSLTLFPLDTNAQGERVSILKMNFKDENNDEDYHYRSFFYTKLDDNSAPTACRFGNRLLY